MKWIFIFLLSFNVYSESSSESEQDDSDNEEDSDSDDENTDEMGDDEEEEGSDDLMSLLKDSTLVSSFSSFNISTTYVCTKLGTNKSFIQENGDMSDENTGEKIDNVAAIAESIQPKGNTLSSTSVSTFFPDTPYNTKFLHCSNARLIYFTCKGCDESSFFIKTFFARVPTYWFRLVGYNVRA